MLKRTMAAILAFLFLSAAAHAKDKQLIGYVHGTHQGYFQLNNLQVACGAETEIVVAAGFESGRIPANCEGIRVGDHVQVIGTEAGTQQVRARRVAIDPLKVEDRIRGYVLLDRAPALANGADGWSGSLYVEGRRLTVTPATRVVFETTDNASLQSLAQVGPNVYVAYEAKPLYEGKLDALVLVFSPNETSQLELDFRKREDPQIIEPDYVIKTPGKIRFGKKYEFELYPDKQMQQRVETIGLALVPEFQRTMKESDLGKLKFRFYVLDTKKQTQLVSSNGVVMISANVVERMKNDAQLAALLGQLVAAAVQEQEFRQQNRKEVQKVFGWTMTAASVISPAGTIAGLINSGAWAKFQRLQQEQAARVGMDYMQRAGFDPREFPAALQELSGKPFSDSQNALARYAFDEIRRYHANDDFEHLKFTADEYQGAAATVPAK